MSFRLRTIGADRKVCEAISLDLFAQIVTPEAVACVLTQFAAHEQRRRKLPHQAVVYLLLAVALHGHLAIDHVIKHVWRSAAFIWPSGSLVPPSRSAFSHRRDRLGARPLAALFRRICVPLASEATKGAFRFGLRLVAIDATKQDVANTSTNERVFGRPDGSRGPAAFCQILCVYLVECGTHAIFDLVVWPWNRSEHEAAERLLRSVTSGMLVLVDRGLYSYNFVEAVRERQAHLLVRLSSVVTPHTVRVLSDGSVLSRIRPTRSRKGQTKRRCVGAHQMVRVISYRMTDPTQPGYGKTYRVLTTLLDEQQAPALDLARCYHERWEIELVIDELDTHQRLVGRPLRSKTPVGVIQEMYALVIAHYTVRALMHQAAVKADLDPDRLSFLGALRVIQDLIPFFEIVGRRQMPRLYGYMLDEISRARLPERRGRSSPRVIRRKMSKWPLKRTHSLRWPHATVPFDQRIALS